MKITQVRDSVFAGRYSPAFASIEVDIMTKEQGWVTIDFDFETFEEVILQLERPYKPKFEGGPIPVIDHVPVQPAVDKATRTNWTVSVLFTAYGFIMGALASWMFL